MKRGIFGLLFASVSVVSYAGYSHEETSNSTGKVYQDGKLLATLEYFNGWKVLCEHKRVSGTPRYQDERRNDAVQRAVAECRLNW